MLTSGTTVQNRYHILRKIGGGGMGTVYLAEDNRLPGRRCAIKEMSPAQLAPGDRNWSIEAFRQEAQMLANLDHPGLTRVTDFFAEGGNWYLTMEYIEGETLDARLARARNGRLSVDEALRIMRQLCDVLTYLHNREPQVIFRDLKPGNIMLTPNGEVKLIDFGIARFFKPGKSQDTVQLGTPGYAAPEQYGGLSQSDPRTDIYSLGAVLHQMVTGYDPTTASSPFPLPDPRSVMPAIPSHIADVITRATQMRPALRYSTIQEMRQALFPPTYPLSEKPSPLQSSSAPQELHQGSPTNVQLEKQQFASPIKLDCTADKAKTSITHSTWFSEANWILGRIASENTLEGQCLTLVGYPGIGITEILNLVKSSIKGNRYVLAQVGGTSEWMNPHEILRALSRQKGTLRRKLKRAIKESRRQVSLRSQEITTSQKNSLKLSLPLELSFGTFKVTPPVEWAREKSVNSTSKPKQGQLQSLTTEQLEALRDLIDYLVEEKVKVILVVDKVLDPHVLQPLYPLVKTPGVMLILTTYYQYYRTWDETDFIRENFLREVYFLERKWNLSRRILDMFIPNYARDTKFMSTFYDYMEFQTRGIPRRFWENLKDFYRERTTPTRFLNLSFGSKKEPILEFSSWKISRIRRIAGIQATIDWQQVFCDHEETSWLQCLPRHKQDHAKSVAYQAIDWLLSRAERQKDFRLRDFQNLVYEKYSLDLIAGRRLSNLISSNIIDMLGMEYKSRGYDATGILH